MRKSFLLVFLLLLCSVNSNQAQVFEDYISEFRGDTAVVKDYIDMGNVANSLVNAVDLDAQAPVGRVYELRTGGLYWNSSVINSPSTRPLNIVGADNTPMVQSENTTSPPIICATPSEAPDWTIPDMLNYSNNVLLKNLIAMPAATDGSQGWTFLTAQSAGNTVELNNVLMETTWWVFIQSNNAADNDLIIKNSYFVNMSGHACRRNGGVYDNVNNNTDTMWVENTTHVMAQGMIYKFRGYPINKAFFNHNTFVNCSGQIFETLGYQSNWTVTNNLFVNSHVQAYRPGLDYTETDQDNLPMGIINVDTLPSSSTITPADRKILVDRNGIYWSPALDQILTDVQGTNGFNNWVTQMMTMNDRTQALFNDNAVYTHLTEGAWIMGGDPQFATTTNLFTDGLDALIEYSVVSADTNNALSMLILRNEGNSYEEWPTYPDWPIPYDLSYTNTAYVSAALGGLPLGDLNWFPAEKILWEAQKDAEHAELETALNEGRLPTLAVETVVGPPADFKVSQNYPNPFNPSTKITFSLPVAGNVLLKVYNAIGEEVATLINGYRTAQTYEVEFDASDLPSGVYVYSLQYGQSTISKKMMLLK